MKHAKSAALAVVMVLALAAPAHAHPGDGAAIGLAAGLLHPLAGPDHLLAMLALGLWAALVGGNARFAWPAAFLAAMVAGAIAGMSGAALPQAETGIAVSVVVLGVAAALRAAPSLLAGAVACAIFGVFHGHAHGAELPLGAASAVYGAAFIATTAALLGLGLVAGQYLARSPRAVLPRIAGGAVAASGLLFLVA